MAIAFDSATNPVIGNPASSITFSHTTSGSDRMLYVGVLYTYTATITGVTYGGTAMTLINAQTATATNSYYMSHWYLLNPATGANNVVVSSNSSVVLIGGSTSYTGVKQSDQPDGSAYNNPTNESTTNTSVTTIADNSWGLLYARTTSSGTSTAGTGTTRRANTDGYIQLYDSNGPKTPAGSLTLQTTQAVQVTAHLMATFSPAVTASGPASLKTLDTIAKASVKTINGIAIASVKTFDTIA